MTIPVSLFFTEQGSGEPLILLHGFPLNSTIWRTQQQRLSDHCRVITPDLRGHGRSPVNDEIYEMDLLARDVIELMDHLNLPQAVVMGHSMGGYVTLALARLAPHRLKAIGLIGSQAMADTEQARNSRYDLIDEIKIHGSAVVADALLPRVFAPLELEDETTKEQTYQMMLNTRPVALINALKGMAIRPDSTALLGELDCPVLIIAGDKDAIIPLERAEAMATPLKNGALVTIENAGHMMMLEQPQATTLAIHNFMEELDS
jgi:pimeloyl-ACP methyl ester carboxylesterase